MGLHVLHIPEDEKHVMFFQPLGSSHSEQTLHGVMFLHGIEDDSFSMWTDKQSNNVAAAHFRRKSSKFKNRGKYSNAQGFDRRNRNSDFQNYAVAPENQNPENYGFRHITEICDRGL